MNLHPGVAIALRRLGSDELGIARMMAAGELASPQQYENVALFAMRITGVGAAYRQAHDEFVWRDPALYLTDEFLARCNGLPVIFEHPQKSVLNSKEFNDRVVGTIFLPYISNGEVWGIAKIYDKAATTMMEEGQLSTSPAVVFRNPDTNSKMEMEDGSTLLIEGKPSLLDHLAICERGVWDKGGEPSGVRSDSQGANTMDPEEKKKADAAAADAAKKDADAGKDATRDRTDSDAGQKLDKLLEMMDSVRKDTAACNARMDAWEEKDKKADASKRDEDGEDMADKAKKDAAKADSKKKDAESDKKELEEEQARMEKRKSEDKERDDAAKADSVMMAAVRAEVRALQEKVAERSDADEAAISDAQVKADTAYNAHGARAPKPMAGEATLDYRLRLLKEHLKHSTTFKTADLSKVARADATTFNVIEDQIYSDSIIASNNPIDIPEGMLREITNTDRSTGQVSRTFKGGGGRTFISGMMPEPRYMKKLNDQFEHRR